MEQIRFAADRRVPLCVALPSPSPPCSSPPRPRRLRRRRHVKPAAQQADPSEPFTPAAAEEERSSRHLAADRPRVADGDSAVEKHPILVTKIDNTTSSSPQVGPHKADLVVEEGLVEGGLTRLAVFFYSEVPDNAGPVRSMRASDIGIVPSDHAAVVTSGAAGSPSAGSPMPASRSSRRARRDLPRHRALGAVQPLRPPDRHGQVRRSSRPCGRPTTCRGATAATCPRARRRRRSPRPSPAGTGPSGATTARATPTQLQRGGRDQFPADTVLGAAGRGRRRRLPRPGGQLRARDALRRHGSGLAVPQRSGHPRDLTAPRTRLTSTLSLRGEGQDHHRARRPRLDGVVPAGPGNVTWQK